MIAIKTAADAHVGSCRADNEDTSRVQSDTRLFTVAADLARAPRREVAYG
ncbi:hypothetical protein [Sorangium sp. So ce1078]